MLKSNLYVENEEYTKYLCIDPENCTKEVIKNFKEQLQIDINYAVRASSPPLLRNPIESIEDIISNYLKTGEYYQFDNRLFKNADESEHFYCSFDGYVVTIYPAYV